MRARFKRIKGFTLIELMVVISIISILLGITIYGTNIIRMKARDAKRKTDLDKVRAGLMVFYADKKSYPLPVNVKMGPNEKPPGALWDGKKAGYNGDLGMRNALFNAGYIETQYTDPKNTYPYRYRYRVSNDGLSFELSAALENDKDPELKNDYPSSNPGFDDSRYEIGNDKGLDTSDVTFSPSLSPAPGGMKLFQPALAIPVPPPCNPAEINDYIYKWIYTFDTSYTTGPCCKIE